MGKKISFLSKLLDHLFISQIWRVAIKFTQGHFVLSLLQITHHRTTRRRDIQGKIYKKEERVKYNKRKTKNHVVNIHFFKYLFIYKREKVFFFYYYFSLIPVSLFVV